MIHASEPRKPSTARITTGKSETREPLLTREQNRPRVDHKQSHSGSSTESEFRFSFVPFGVSIPSIEQLPPIELRARFFDTVQLDASIGMPACLNWFRNGGRWAMQSQRRGLG